MEEYVGLLIGIARRRLQQLVLAHATRYGLSGPQFWFLVGIAEQPGTSQAELSARVHRDAPTTSRIVTTLAERGLVRTADDPADRRRTRLVLTAEGTRIAAELAPIARELRAAVTEGMPGPEVERLRGGLRRVIENLEGRLAREAASAVTTDDLAGAARSRLPMARAAAEAVRAAAGDEVRPVAVTAERNIVARSGRSALARRSRRS